MLVEDVHRLSDIVRDAATAELIPRFEKTRATEKADGSLLTEADLAVQRGIQDALAAHWPEVAFLGEEMSSGQQQTILTSSAQGLWCLDPLDGTANFAAGIPFFAVSLAYIESGEVRIGIIFDPVRDECFSAGRGQGARLNGELLTCRAPRAGLSEAMAIVDLKRLPPSLVRRLAAEPPYRSQRSFGSVALDWCWVAASRCQVYLHGGQRLWDYAAGELIASESGARGGVLSDYDGDWQQELCLDKRIGLAASNDDLLAEWRAWIETGV